MNKREQVIGIVMIFVLAVWALFSLAGPKGNKNTILTPPIAQQEQKTNQGAAGVSDEGFSLDRFMQHLELRSEEVDVSSVVDPFVKLDQRSMLKDSPMEFSDLLLEGIIWEEEEPVALINEEILKVGDVVAGFEIEEIRKSEVVLMKGMEKYILRLFVEVPEE